MPTTFFLSSGTANSVSPDGSRFDVKFEPPLRFPPNTTPRVALRAAAIWNTFSNISPEAAFLNNKWFYTDDVSNATKYDVALPEGCYSLGDLELALTHAIAATGRATLDDPLFRLHGIEATSRVYVEVTKVGWQVNFVNFPSGAGGMSDILGFTQNVPPAALTTVVNYTQLGMNRAQIDRVDSVLVNCDLVGGQSYIGGDQSDGLAHILITAKPGSMVDYAPSDPLWIDCPHLSGATVGKIAVYLTDQFARPVDTGHESFTVTLEARED